MLLHRAANVVVGGGMYKYEQQDSSHVLRGVGADVTPLHIAIFISGPAAGVPHDGQKFKYEDAVLTGHQQYQQ